MRSELREAENFLVKRDSSEKIDLESEVVSRELYDYAEALAEISGDWNPVEIYTPSARSREIETERFLEAYHNGQIYHPKFSYPRAERLDLEGEAMKLRFLLGRVRSFLPTSRLERLARAALYYKIKDDLATCQLVSGIKTENEQKIKAAVHRKYGKPEQTVYDKARDVLDQRISGEADTEAYEYDSLLSEDEKEFLRQKDFNALAIKEAFEWSLREYGLLRDEENPSGYIVVIDENAVAIDVRDKSSQGRAVFIPKDRVVKGHKLLELIAHEIEGHARQSMNGEKLFGLGGGSLKIDGEILYEGLGKRYEAAMRRELLGEDTARAVPFLPLAIETAEQGGSFYDVFIKQKEYRLRDLLGVGRDEALPEEIDQEDVSDAEKYALQTTVRVMRGHTDMSNPTGFAMTKDMAYLAGELLDEELNRFGLGYINETGVIQSGGLQLLAELALDQDDLPYKFKNIARSYWLEVIRPMMNKVV